VARRMTVLRASAGSLIVCALPEDHFESSEFVLRALEFASVVVASRPAMPDRRFATCLFPVTFGSRFFSSSSARPREVEGSFFVHG